MTIVQIGAAPVGAPPITPRWRRAAAPCTAWLAYLADKNVCIGPVNPAVLVDARVRSLATIGRCSGHLRTIAIWFTCYPSKRYLNAARAQNAN